MSDFDEAIAMGDVDTIRFPEYSDWQCEIAGVIYTPFKGKEPNWFWRQMQFLAFGAKWERRT